MPRIDIEELYNEGASALLDITGLPFTRQRWLACRAAFEKLPEHGQIAVILETYRRSPTFNPQTGTFVCFCCGKNFWEVHGRRFLLN